MSLLSPFLFTPMKVLIMTDTNDFDELMAEINGTPAGSEAVAVTEPTPHTEPDVTEPEVMPDMPAPESKDGGKPLYAEINPELKSTHDVSNCEALREVTVYPSGYTKIVINSGRRSNSFFLYEDQWDQLTEFVRSDNWDALKALLKDNGFRNRGE